MIKYDKLLFISVLCFPVVASNVVRNVRLIEPIPYMIKVITKTMRLVEELEWCNLDIPKAVIDMNEIVYGVPVVGKVTYKNGFVVSIGRLGIVEHTLGQNWRYDRTANTTTAEITGTVTMIDVALGFDVEANLADRIQNFTSQLILPDVSFDIKIIRDMFTNALEVSIVPRIRKTTNKMKFLPANKITDVFANLHDLEEISVGVSLWTSKLLQPFALDIVENVLEYPAICYDCPVV